MLRSQGHPSGCPWRAASYLAISPAPRAHHARTLSRTKRNHHRRRDGRVGIVTPCCASSTGYRPSAAMLLVEQPWAGV
ncbi:hypothetical protein BDZ89DRAFT_1076155 [Hymenopellis radicata]|nr:hypothetical protein BDZ89DRAFT_1076155 [Hymenopellis radicata]